VNFEPMDNALVDPHRFLQAGHRQAVPLVVFHDDSGFGRAAARMLAAITEPEMAAAVLSGESLNPDATIAQVTSVGFQQRMSPLRLWTHQPLWCAWFADERATSLADLARTIASLRIPGVGGANHFVFLHTQDAVTPDHALAKVASAVFLSSDQGTVHRSLPLLAEGAVSLLYSGWKEHCLAANHSLIEALLLTPNQRVYALGVSTSEPDWDFHAFYWKQALESAVLHEWRKPCSISLIGDSLESAKKSLDRLLRFGEGWRDGEVVVRPARSHQDPQTVIHVGKESLEVTCQVKDDGDSHEIVHGSARHKLAVWLGQSKSLDLFLRFVALANFRRLINSRSAQLEADWTSDAWAFLRTRQPVRGYLGNLHKRMLGLLEWAKERERATVIGDDTTPSFKQQEKEVLKRISAVPNGVGLALRLMLVGWGLTWLILSPVWASAGAGWQHDILNAASLISGAFFLIISTAGIGHWLYFRWRALRAVEQARHIVLAGFQAQLCGILAGAFNRAGKRIAAQANEWLVGFTGIAEKLGNEGETGHAAEPKNDNPFFPKGCLVSILDNQIESLVQATHERFVSQWAEQPESFFAQEKWRKMLAEVARQVSREALDKLTYTECLKARNPSAQELSFLVADLCHEARMPSLEIGPLPNPPPALLVGLEDAPDRLPDVQVRELTTPKLLAVSVIPFIADL